MTQTLALSLVIKAKDDATKTIGGIGKALGGMGKIAAGLGVGAVVGIAAIGGAIAKITVDAMKLPDVERRFTNLSASIGETSESMLGPLRDAVQGTVTDFDLMLQGSKLMSMGLADTSEEAAHIAEIVYQLGDPTQSATANMENFALMLANQSVPRLDSFGISAGTVKTRIVELMEANEGMTREEAFMIATMEQAEIAMGKVGKKQADLSVVIAQGKTMFANAKMEIGAAFIPIAMKLAELVMPLMSKALAAVVPIIERVADWIGTQLPIALQKASDFWTNTLQPAIQRVWAFVQDSVIPMLINLKNWLAEKVPEAIEKLRSWWDDTAIPALKRVWEYISVNIIPIFIDIKDWLAEKVPIAIETLLEFWEGSLLPALKEGWRILSEDVIPILVELAKTAFENIKKIVKKWIIPLLERLWKLVDTDLKRVLTWLNEHVLEPLAAGFGAVKSAVQWVIDKINALVSAISGFSLPGWVDAFLPGSDPPLAIGMIAVAQAIGAAEDAFRDLRLEIGMAPEWTGIATLSDQLMGLSIGMIAVESAGIATLASNLMSLAIGMIAVESAGIATLASNLVGGQGIGISAGNLMPAAPAGRTQQQVWAYERYWNQPGLRGRMISQQPDWFGPSARSGATEVNYNLTYYGQDNEWDVVRAMEEIERNARLLDG